MSGNYIIADYRQKGLGTLRGKITLPYDGEIKLRYGIKNPLTGVVDLFFLTHAVLTDELTEAGELVFKDKYGHTFYLPPIRYRELQTKNCVNPGWVK